MAKQNFHKYINEIGETASLKKYIYILRSIACVLWIEKKKSPPPKNYKKVINLLPENAQKFFRKIVSEKKESESTKGERNREIENYITSFFGKKFGEDKSKFNMKELNKIFKDTIKN